MKVKRATEAQITAYHEAGHAVAAFVLQRRFTLISIIPELLVGAAGYITFDPPHLDLDAGDRQLVEHEIMLRLAGLAAEEAKFAHNPWQSRVGDLPQARSMIAFLYDDTPPDLLLIRLYNQTKELLHTNWQAVDTVAQELLNYGELREYYVRHVIRTALTSYEDM